MKTKNLPFFTIIIPTLNEETCLPLLLKDLILQTNTDFEVIVVDGHSEDKTKEVSMKFAEKLPLTFLDSPKRNVCSQRNYGAQNSHSAWLLFMDADNRIPPYFIQGLRYQIDKHNPNFFTTFIDPDGQHSLDATIAQIINTFVFAQKNTKNPSLFESMIGIKKNLFVKHHGFDEKIPFAEGPELAKRLLAKKVFLSVFKEPRYTYSFRRIRKQGALKSLRNSAYLIVAQQTGMKLDKKIYQKYYPMLGGTFFKNQHTAPSPIETIFVNLINKYEIPKMIEKLNQPINLPKNPFEKLFRKK